ncbi:hypothetical protein [Rugosimonospora africana]|uniref:Translation initiation factor n=1 Tax=Rugosimonospora africana TaxID=556532 RepID=A0A8J3R1L9_9ACTN|nr:hypothetical protein [Rugosimonospora africana]GIH20823.1 hypothetical protein Raf01_89950 [Rugosimonospora africana]
MSTAPGASQGLSNQDIESIRDGLVAGRRPKVVFTEAAGQIVGQLGQVVQLTDPEVGDDFLVVRFGRDELPFSPADLAIAPKTPPRKPAKPAPEFKLSDPPIPTAREEKEPMSTPTVDDDNASPAEPDASADAAPARGPAARKAAKQAKPKPQPGLTVTLSYADSEWTVAAQQGAKVLAKPYVIKATEALMMVGMLDVAGVQEAVEQIVSAERAEARNQAERLRAELAEIEAKLAELGEAGEAT